MAILEWFGIVFDAETDKAVKGTNDLEKANKGVEEQLGKVSKASDKAKTSLLKVATQAVTAFTSIVSFNNLLNFTKSSLSYADSLGKLSKSLGIAVEEVSAWSDAVTKAGGSAEGFKGTVSKLSKDIYQLSKTGKSSIKPFIDKLGVSLLDASGKARNVLDVLPEIAEAMEKMSEQDIQGLGQKLGFDQGTIMLLQQGRRGVEELVARQKELGVVTQAQADATAKFNDTLDDTKHRFRGVFLELGLAILPALNWFLKKIQEIVTFAKDHKEFVIGFFTLTAGAITLYYLPAMKKAAITTLAATWPLLALAAACLLVALVAEDLYYFLTGQNSVIGELSKKWPILGKVIEGIRNWFIWLFESAAKVIKFFSDMWDNPGQALEDFKLVLKTLWNDFIDSVPGLRAVLDTVVKIFDTAIAAIKATIEAVTNSIKTAKDVVTGKKSLVTVEPSSFADFNASMGTVAFTPKQQAEMDARAAKKLQQAQQLTPTVAGMGQSVTNHNLANNRNAVTNNNVTINGTNLTEKQIENVVKNSLGNITKTASSQLDDGQSH